MARLASHMKLRASHKIGIGFCVVIATSLLGWKFVSEAIIMGKKFEPLEPSEVSLVGVDTRAGYYIVVANQVAQLVFGKQGEFAGPGDATASDSSEKLRIPLREMLLSLKGDEKALGHFIMRMNEMSDAELPAQPRTWKAEDIQKALDGDAALEAKLVADLNVRLDGTPLDVIRPSTIQEGIVIESPITLNFKFGSQPRTYTGRIREEYRPKFMRALDKSLSEKSAQTIETVRGYYLIAARELQDNPNDKEDVRQSLLGRIGASRLKGLATRPEQILNSITVVINDRLIEGASKSTYKTNEGKVMSDLALHLNGEGRDRLWQYSKKHLGSQLLLVWDGIAIAAPRIQHELAFPEVKVTQLYDEGLVDDTIRAIEQLKEERKSN